MFLAIISPSSSCSSFETSEMSAIFFSQPNNSTSSPGLLGSDALTRSGLHFWRHFLVKHKILPNLVISNWLWWIMRVLLANQNWGAGSSPFLPMPRCWFAHTLANKTATYTGQLLGIFPDWNWIIFVFAKAVLVNWWRLRSLCCGSVKRIAVSLFLPVDGIGVKLSLE